MRASIVTLALSAALAACSAQDDGRPDSRTADGVAERRAAGGEVAPAACAGDNAGLTLPPGFCATVFADSLGPIRHIAVAANGDVFVNGRARRARQGAGAEAGAAPAPIIALRDANKDGRAETIERFGEGGGTGIALHDGFLYADAGARILRYPLAAGQLKPGGPPQVVVSGLPTGGHDARNFAIGRDGALYVNIGSLGNVCLEEAKAGRQGPGPDPCRELESRAGVWKFSAGGTDQTPTLQTRFATGIRNAVGLAIGPDGRLYATQHGRDALHENWGAMYTKEQGAELPAEVLLQVNQGDDFGWPYCYYDHFQKALVLAPEYGGDGKTTGRCAQKKGPVAAFPGHWAPNGLAFYTGRAFPERWRGGAFIAFHGSWNRGTDQKGFRVSFVPMSGGRVSGDTLTFADGFAGTTGPIQNSGQAAHRPTGLAVGPDGALYISDDRAGRLYRVTYGDR